MQALVALAFAIVSTMPYVSKSAEVTDPKAIQAFLADPQTHAYNVRDPVGWKSYRKIIQIGTRLPNGSCKYPLAVSTPGTYVSFATEIAVNHARCQSLVLEGNPGGAPTKTALGAVAKNPKSPDPAKARPVNPIRPASTPAASPGQNVSARPRTQR